MFAHWRNSETVSESAVRNLLFEQLKGHPKMQLVIDRCRNASSSSSKRSSKWLYDKLVEMTEIHQLEDNTVSVEKSLAEMGSSKTNKPTEANANVAKAGKEKEKPDKSKAKAETPKKEEKDSKESKKEQGGKETKDTNRSKDVAAAANATEGTGKGASKSSQDKNDKQQQPYRSKRPCMYFAFDSCTKGEKCQYLHDKKNLYKGPKPAGLKSSADDSAGAATVHAGVGHVVAGAVIGSSVKGASAEGVSCHQAPQTQSKSSQPFAFANQSLQC